MKPTSDQISGIAEAVQQGSTRDKACKAHGIDPVRYRAILRLAADGDAICVNFIRGLDQAEAEFEAGLVGTISASRDWRAAAFILERRYPDEWAQKIQIEVEQRLNEIWAIAEGALDEKNFIKLLQAVTSRVNSQPVVAEGAVKKKAVH